MDQGSNRLKRNLRRAGLGDSAIGAAWPRWWSDAAANSPSARAELRFTLARRLGLAPRSLVDDRVEFVWRDEARFKHLSGESDVQRAALTSFGIVIGHLLLSSTEHHTPLVDVEPNRIRAELLNNSPFVDLATLLAMCWALGLPVVHLRVFPLVAKRMHAMVVREGDRHAILLGRDASYPAYVAFDVAHEFAHVVLGHVKQASALVEISDPLEGGESDDEESSADSFALTLLTGTDQPDIRPDRDQFGARQLATAALKVAPGARIEPGTIALCHAYRSGEWAKASAAMRYIYTEPKPTWREVNGVASTQIDWHALSDDRAEYLRIVMGLDDV